MVSYLNVFLQQELDAGPNVRDRHEDYSGSLVSTHNILLEYGDRDLESFFVQVVPPFLEAEIVGFWKELFEVAKAVATIHDYKNPDTGKSQAKGYFC